MYRRAAGSQFAQITAGPGRLGRDSGHLDGWAVIPATWTPSPTSVLFAMPAEGPPFAASPRGFHGRELRVRKYVPAGARDRSPAGLALRASAAFRAAAG